MVYQLINVLHYHKTDVQLSDAKLSERRLMSSDPDLNLRTQIISIPLCIAFHVYSRSTQDVRA